MSEAPSIEDRQRDRAEAAALNQAQVQAPTASEKKAYMESVLDTELDDASIEMISNMFVSDFMLGNLQDAEVWELKKLREITLKRIFANHPSQRAIMQGDLRQQVYGDNAAPLKPLTQTQKEKIQQGVHVAFANLSRGREGFQQEQFSKSISESHVERQGKDDSGWLSFS